MTVTHGGNIFAVSRARGWDWRTVADFSASINPLGPSPAVQTAIGKAIERIPHYPERDCAELRDALARVWNIGNCQILPGNGATELLHWFARMERPQKVTLGVPVFAEFHRAFPDASRVPLSTPAEWPREGLLVLTQPDNPTGAALCPDSLERWLLATTNPVLIDESFLEFTGLPSVSTLLERRPHLYILRSLTKFYALPGLRVGALLASSNQLGKWSSLREPWQVNVLAEAAALAAIEDRDHARRSLDFIAAERARLFDAIDQLPGAHPTPSHANYLFVRLDYRASALCRYLCDRRILVRDCTAIPGIETESVRIAVRTHHENERLIGAWKEFPCGL